MEKMANITLSMDKNIQEKLRDISKKERRSISQQVVFMMEFYIKFKDNVK